jgi:hypothetical protein
MEIKSITQATIAYHDAAEELAHTLNQAVADRRFKMTLEDARHFRELVDDAELLGNRAWRSSLEIPVELRAAAKK